MPVKSSRFSRMAYARRAALLAEALSEWHQIYVTQVDRARKRGLMDPQTIIHAERIPELQSMVLRLNDVASELVALR